jgi:hypothetical protein
MALSRKKIAAERANVKLRTERRIAQLYTDAGITTGNLELRNWHSCLNTSCKITKKRYISVITKKSVIFRKSKINFNSTGSVPVSLHPTVTLTDDYFQLYMLSKMRNQYFTS